MERWSTQWGWFDRAASWDEYMLDVERRAAELQAQERAKIWLDRDEKLRERRWKIAEALLQKAEQMLQFPLATVTRDNPDGTTTVVKPGKWSFGQAARLIETGMEQSQAAVRNLGSLTGEATDEREELWDVEDYTPGQGESTAK
jgi:hypothetical protein